MRTDRHIARGRLPYPRGPGRYALPGRAPRQRRCRRRAARSRLVVKEEREIREVLRRYLDLGLPDVEGLEVLAAVRDRELAA